MSTSKFATTPSHNFKDLTGQCFGNWTVVARAENSGSGHVRWLCKCGQCGRTKTIYASNLKRTFTTHCFECHLAQSKPPIFKKTTHGHVIGGHRSKTYQTWLNIRDRCTNEKHKHFEYYGGRGITVCDRWLHSFENFLADMGERPERMTIDRIDNDGHYEPANCRWATASEQVRNQRRHKRVQI